MLEVVLRCLRGHTRDGDREVSPRLIPASKSHLQFRAHLFRKGCVDDDTTRRQICRGDGGELTMVVVEASKDESYDV